MHEVRYRELKHSAHRGWGAEQVPEREESWRTYWRTWTCAPIAPEDFPKSGKVLELGAGAGNISPIIENSGYDVTGIEISPIAVEMASKRNPGIPYFDGKYYGSVALSGGVI